MNTGYFSEALQNMAEHKNSLTSIKGLSTKASKINQEAIALMTSNITYMSDLQKELQVSCNLMLTNLQYAIELVNTQSEKSIGYIKKTNKTALEFNKKTEEAITHNGDLKTKTLDLSQELHKVLVELEKEGHRLTVEEQKAKDKANKYKKEKYYFLALGPFGLAGLASATALFTTWDSKAKTATNKANKVRKEIDQIKKFQTQINKLQDGFGISIELLSNLKNTLVFLTSDIDNVLSNVSSGNETTEVLSLYLNASVKQLEIMKVEIA